MRTTGEFSIHRFVIPFDKYNETHYLIPFGDVHKSSPMHATTHWKDFLQWGKQKPRAYFLGMGDYDDLASTSERKILSDPDLHESTFETLEELYMNNVNRFAKDIMFMKKRIVGLLGGNHYGMFQDGTNTDQRLCRLLEARYLGCNSFIRLVFVCSNRGKTNHSNAVDIFAHHGRGGTGTVGSSINKVYDLGKNAEADIYLMGDNHQKEIAMRERLVLRGLGDRLTLAHRKQLYARTGSYLKAYEPGHKSYSVDAAFAPSNLGSIKIELTPRREKIDGMDRTWIDIHASL